MWVNILLIMIKKQNQQKLLQAQSVVLLYQEVFIFFDWGFWFLWEFKELL